jgi:hypothetical protein
MLPDQLMHESLQRSGVECGPTHSTEDRTSICHHTHRKSGGSAFNTLCTAVSPLRAAHCGGNPTIAGCGSECGEH